MNAYQQALEAWARTKLDNISKDARVVSVRKYGSPLYVVCDDGSGLYASDDIEGVSVDEFAAELVEIALAQANELIEEQRKVIDAQRRNIEVDARTIRLMSSRLAARQS